MRRSTPLLLVLAVAGLFGSLGCNPITKLARSPLVADRDSAAFAYYNREKYADAAILFENLLPIYRNSPRAELIIYYYANALMNSRNYIQAGYYYERLVQNFPNSKYAQQSFFNIGMCHYYQANDFDLDQTESLKAIESFQLFVGLYPDAPQVPQLNQRVRELRDRMAHKAYYSTELYYNIGHFQAAMVAAQTTIRQYPDSKYREDTQFIQFKAAVAYADGSILAKQRERYSEALKYYNSFVKRFPQSKHLREAERLKDSVERSLEKLPS